jgi:hypothetical protein
LLDRTIPAQRIVPLKPKSDPGYYVLDQDEMDRYARGGSAAVDWSPPTVDGGIDHSRHWKAI